MIFSTGFSVMLLISLSKNIFQIYSGCVSLSENKNQKGQLKLSRSFTISRISKMAESQLWQDIKPNIYLTFILAVLLISINEKSKRVNFVIRTQLQSHIPFI
jgi:hypothetical protein